MDYLAINLFIMVIGIDASRVETTENTGTENYSLNLIRRLAKIDRTNSYILYSRKKLKNKLAPKDLGANFKNRVISCPVFWTHCGLSTEMFLKSPDILFVPAHVLPLIHPKNSVVAIHGLEYEYCPESYTYLSRNYLRQSTIFSAKNARKIIVPSNNTKNDLVKFYKINPGKIAVIPHGMAEYPAIAQEKKENGNNSERCILFIGRLEARKNIIRLVEAFNIFKKKNSTVKNIKLVLAGKKGVGFDKIRKTIANSAYRSDIILKGYVSETEKNRLLKNALVFAYPSLYEGFGLPILEAQAAGVPVLSSNVSSIPEVAGEGAVLVDPKSIGEIANALTSLSLNSDLRKKVIAGGFENTKRFSWEKCARETLKVLTM